MSQALLAPLPDLREKGEVAMPPSSREKSMDKRQEVE